jgi:protein TonB
MSAHLDFIDAAGPRLRRWLIAGFLMVSVHATAGAHALMTWPEEETVEDTNGAFLLEIAPVPVSPPPEKLNLAAGPRTDEVAAASAIAPTPAVQEKSDVETPKVAEAPLAPRPEVIVQKQQPIEKPDDKQVKEDPRPTQVNI